MHVIDVVRQQGKFARMTGLFLIVMGILALLAPMAAGLSVALIVGVLLTVGGISKLALAFRAGANIWIILLGGLTLALGIYMLMNPVAALAALTLFLALYFVFSGITEVVVAFGAKPADGWAWLLFSGVISLLLGLMIWSQFPFSGAWAIGILVGIRLLMSGVMLMTIGGAAKNLAAAAEQ